MADPEPAEDEEFDPLEEAVYVAQIKWIEKECGKDAANHANYGWGVDCLADETSICTKVYGHGYLTTSTKDPQNHRWEPF